MEHLWVREAGGRHRVMVEDMRAGAHILDSADALRAGSMRQHVLACTHEAGTCSHHSAAHQQFSSPITSLCDCSHCTGCRKLVKKHPEQHSVCACVIQAGLGGITVCVPYAPHTRERLARLVQNLHLLVHWDETPAVRLRIDGSQVQPLRQALRCALRDFYPSNSA